MKHIHAKVDGPLLLRKTVLGSALATAETIKSLESIKAYTQQKLTIKAKLSSSLRGLQATLATLKKGIPPLPKEFIAKQVSMQKKAMLSKQVAQAKAPSAKVLAEQEQLDHDIVDIKRRIAQIHI